MILSKAACFHHENWLNSTKSNNLRELYPNIFSRDFIKVINLIFILMALFFSKDPAKWNESLNHAL